MTNSKLTLQELESRLWAAANALRGPVDPSDFKAYVFPVLFLKWISDTWTWEHAQAIEDFGEDVLAEEAADYHRFAIPEGCHWYDLKKVSTNVGSALQKLLDRLQEANHQKLAGVFGDVAWGNKDRLPEANLLNLIDSFDSLRLNPEHVTNDSLGQAYEYLLREFADASGKKAGEFFTPREVVHLLVHLLAPTEGETIYDPACGSGGMLVETVGAVKGKGGDPRTLRLRGQEVNLTTSAIARMNLYIHNIEDFSILRGDTLRDPKHRTPTGDIEKFDVVIANPPFSLSNWGAETWATDPRAACGVPPAGNGDYAWVQHMLASMDPRTGRVGVVMPHGILFRGGSEAAIRQCLIESDELDAVVGLPPNLFYSTSIPACLLIFRAKKPKSRKDCVLFVDASERYTAGRNQNHMSEDDIQATIEAFRTGDGPDGEGDVRVRLVEHAEIKENGWDLNVSRYLRGEVEAVLSVEDALSELADAQIALRDAEVLLSQRLKAAGYA
ncbi:MAG: class I SAM-dependent DNA methyltransferase [Microthrixaceae bacterium]